MIYRNKITDTITEIHLSDVPSGMYVVRLINQYGRSSTVKIIKH